MDQPPAYKFTATDPHGNTIVCTLERWQHIMKQRKYWDTILDCQARIIQAIEHPILVTTDAEQTKNIQIYIFIPGFKTHYLKIIVLLRKKTGYVITAYETSKGRTGEKLLW